MIYLFLFLIAFVLVILFKNKIIEYFHPFSDDNEIQFKAAHYVGRSYKLYYSCNGGKSFRPMIRAEPDNFFDVHSDWVINNYTFIYMFDTNVRNFKKYWENYSDVLEHEKEQCEKVRIKNEIVRKQREEYYMKMKNDLNL